MRLGLSFRTPLLQISKTHLHEWSMWWGLAGPVLVQSPEATGFMGAKSNASVTDTDARPTVFAPQPSPFAMFGSCVAVAAISFTMGRVGGGGGD